MSSFVAAYPLYLCFFSFFDFPFGILVMLLPILNLFCFCLCFVFSLCFALHTDNKEGLVPAFSLTSVCFSDFSAFYSRSMFSLFFVQVCLHCCSLSFLSSLVAWTYVFLVVPLFSLSLYICMYLCVSFSLLCASLCLSTFLSLFLLISASLSSLCLLFFLLSYSRDRHNNAHIFS